MTFRDNRANSTKQNVKRERYSDMPLFTMIIMHALTAMFSWVSLGNHPILQLSTSCLSRTFSNVISMAESQSIMIHDNGENEDFCVKWGPFQQFGPHEDQVLNWGPFRKHWLLYSNRLSKTICGLHRWGVRPQVDQCLVSASAAVERRSVSEHCTVSSWPLNNLTFPFLSFVLIIIPTTTTININISA